MGVRAVGRSLGWRRGWRRNRVWSGAVSRLRRERIADLSFGSFSHGEKLTGLGCDAIDAANAGGIYRILVARGENTFESCDQSVGQGWPGRQDRFCGITPGIGASLLQSGLGCRAG
jgi:hypothetical protein